jgi:N-acetylmuramoyl-L-alanine amidase
MIANTTFLQRIPFYFVALLLIFVPIKDSFAQKGAKIRTVVIDAGHGGRDPGAVGKNSKEKDIVLSVALKTGTYIRQNLPDVKVIFTRSKDEFIELHRRAAIANENNADLFISIHCNASTDTKVYGAETFVMGEHKTQANLEVAKLENAAILFEENASEEYGDFDPNSTAAYIALSLFQSDNKQQSIKVAQQVQEQFTKRVGRKDRSVQQAGFLVLYKTSMPSVLIELGFITNPAEEKFLLSEEGQVYMASAIYRSFKEYKQQYERDNTLPLNIPDEWKEVLAPQKDKPVAKEEKPVVKKEETPTAKVEKQETIQQPETKKTVEETVKTSESTNNTVVFKVQFALYNTKIAVTDKRFSRATDVDVYFHDGMYKYTSGKFSGFKEATAHQSKLRKLGFEDAFVVAFSDGKRVAISDSMKK